MVIVGFSWGVCRFEDSFINVVEIVVSRGFFCWGWGLGRSGSFFRGDGIAKG